MLMITGVVLALLFAAAVAPDSPLGEILIQAPARFLASLSGWNAELALLPGLAMIGLVVLAPELVLLLGLADLSVFTLVGVPALLLGAGAVFTRLRRRIAETLGWMVTVVRAAVSGRRPARARPRRRRPRPPRSDPSDDPTWAWA